MNGVPIVKAMHKWQLEAYAAEIADRLDCYPGRIFKPIDMPRLLEVKAHQEFGLNVVIQDIDPNIEGITIPGDPSTLVFPVTIYDQLADLGNGRDRFTAGHEFGHVTIHAPQLTQEYRSFNPKTLRLYRRSDIPYIRDPEWQANKFATYLLMPKWAMLRAIKQHGPNARVLAGIFQVSFEAMTYRLGELGHPS